MSDGGYSVTITVQAVYAGGVLRPLAPLSLKEGQTVEVTVASTGPAEPLLSEEETVRRIRACKTFHEWVEVTQLLPTNDGGYDIVKALDENRRWSGDRPILSDEAGKS
jgi:predicted DNA-binding antitoxin AbrB/MazE fold protein